MNKLFTIAVCALALTANAQWETLTDILTTAVSQKVFPGAVAAVFTEKEILYKKAVGSLTYGVPPPATPNSVPAMTTDTIFDMASCTKVAAGTSAMALLYEWGTYDLQDKVSKYLPDFAQNGKGDVTIEHILAHHSGLAPDPSPGFATASYACPAMIQEKPELSFSCRNRCYETTMKEKLVTKPGEAYAYSDISFMTVMNIVGVISKSHKYVIESDIREGCPIGDVGEAQCYFEAFVRKYIINALGLKDTMFNPPKNLWYRIMPTTNDTTRVKKQLQGEVHDPNTFAMGGISGHAGLFSTVEDMIVLLRAWLFAPEKSPVGFLNKTTTELWIKQVNSTVSSRALGWNTNADNASDYGWGHVCGTLSNTTFTHTGYTGTILCGDPVRGLGTILLGTRVYPTDSHSSENKQVRVDFHSTVQKIYDNLYN